MKLKKQKWRLISKLSGLELYKLRKQKRLRLGLTSSQEISPSSTPSLPAAAVSPFSFSFHSHHGEGREEQRAVRPVEGVAARHKARDKGSAQPGYCKPGRDADRVALDTKVDDIKHKPPDEIKNASEGAERKFKNDITSLVF